MTRNPLASFCRVAVVAVITGLAGASPLADVRADETVAVRVADPQNVGAAPIYVALDQGFFADEGLTIELVATDPTLTVQSVATGQLDFGLSLADPALFNALRTGIAVKLVASSVVNGPDSRTAVLMVRADVLDSGTYTSARDLAGTRIASPTRAADFYVALFLATAHMSQADVDLVTIAAPEIGATFASGAITAAWVPEPFATAVQAQGLARTVATTGDLLPGATASVLIMSPSFGANQPEASERFVAAYVRGLRAYWHALDVRDSDPDPIIHALTNHTPIKDPALYARMGLPIMDPNAALDLSSWSAFQAYFVQQGLQDSIVDLGPYLDTALLETTLDKIGRQRVLSSVEFDRNW
jgi:NitT/TauT family transport system substrate-binding protein